MAKKGAGSKADTVVKLVLMFFISLLSFSVGTYVGKQVSESEYQALQYESNEYKSFRDVASAEKEVGKELKEDAISEEEVSQLAEEFMAKEKNETEPHGKDHAQKAKSSKTKPTVDGYKNMKSGKSAESPGQMPKAKTADKTTSEAQRVAAGKAPVADPKKKRKPASVFPKVASDTIGRYTVQVSSYSNQEEAETHAKTLKSKGYDAFYLKADVKGRTWFRVSVGLFASLKDAKTYKNKLKKDSVVSSAIVQRIVK